MSGPLWDSELMKRFSRAQQADAYGFDSRMLGLGDRVVEAETWEALPQADKDFIDEMNRHVDNGASSTLQDPSEWGTFEQWQAEDRRLDAADDADDADDDEERDTKSAEVPSGDEGDWIGV